FGFHNWITRPFETELPIDTIVLVHVAVPRSMVANPSGCPLTQVNASGRIFGEFDNQVRKEFRISSGECLHSIGLAGNLLERPHVREDHGPTRGERFEWFERGHEVSDGGRLAGNHKNVD